MRTQSKYHKTYTNFDYIHANGKLRHKPEQFTDETHGNDNLRHIIRQ